MEEVFFSMLNMLMKSVLPEFEVKEAVIVEVEEVRVFCFNLDILFSSNLFT